MGRGPRRGEFQTKAHLLPVNRPKSPPGFGVRWLVPQGGRADTAFGCSRFEVGCWMLGVCLLPLTSSLSPDGGGCPKDG